MVKFLIIIGMDNSSEGLSISYLRSLQTSGFCFLTAQVKDIWFGEDSDSVGLMVKQKNLYFLIK